MSISLRTYQNYQNKNNNFFLIFETDVSDREFYAFNTRKLMDVILT